LGSGWRLKVPRLVSATHKVATFSPSSGQC